MGFRAETGIQAYVQMKGYSEDELVEQPAISTFERLYWETADCFDEFDDGPSFLGRETKGEVVLLSRLRPALEKLNPDVAPEAIELAIEELTRDRSAMSMVAANREIFDLIKGGVKVTYLSPDDESKEIDETIEIIDWNDPETNDYFLASQFWITGEMYTRRADLIGFINGIPLVFVELKAAHKNTEDAFSKNLRDYKATIPHLFWYNAFIILSNGSESKIGTISADWGHFSDWKKIASETEEGIVSLETMIRGTCERRRLLDLVENFTLFMESKGGLIKIVGKNHQFLGVNSALAGIQRKDEAEGQLGVFWHTQGSGKSISMIFFAQKVLRKVPGDWTFVIVTDRRELDKQIYKNFANAGVVTKKQVQATSGEHLQDLLREDHRYVFTLIQKFRIEKGKKYPKLSDRSDIIVMTDEAHRSQYDTFALNMRNALPRAAFIGFTGTPLMAGEEKTKRVFGDYVSVYSFKQSSDDGATVPLYYENRIPELQLTNENLNEDMERLLEEAELDERQEAKVEREFAREYHLITRDDRLEKVAADIVEHFFGRGYKGKAMVVSIDKATAVKMYDKVQKYWKRYLKSLEEELQAAGDEEAEMLRARLDFAQSTDMAVVVSQSQNEVGDLQAKGVDIEPHRRRMVTEDLDEKFKDPENPLRLVFVCAMWMTGFDVPSCSTIYLDKPMRNHTLMQTIARANRVFGEKKNGLIVDYVGVFRNLQQALSIYGSGSGGGIKEGESPIEDKAELVEMLRKLVEEAREFCDKLGVDLNAIVRAEGFQRIKLLDDAVEALVVDEETKREFSSRANQVVRLYKAVLPDPVAAELAPECIALAVIAEKIRSITPPADISDVMQAVDKLLDDSIAAGGYIIRGAVEEHLIDLSKIDFDELRERFEKGRKRTELEKLKASIQSKINRMVRLNRTRMDFLERFQQMIDAYNAGALNVEEFFRRLLELANDLKEEEKRAVRENLTEEELAVFDLLTKPEMDLTETEVTQVKKIARELLLTLTREKLVIDWRKRQQTRAAVRVAIEQEFDRLPDKFTTDLWNQKCESIYQHIYESYRGEGASIYGLSA